MSDLGTVSSVPPEWQVLLPVVVGGVIGIMAGVIGPYFIQRARDAADRRRKRAEKLEELIGAVVEHYHWFAAMRYFVISGQGNQPTLSPITKIEAITGTYFPEFETLVRRLDYASNEYEKWILNVGQKRVRNETGYEQLVGHEEVGAKYTNARAALIEALKQFACRKVQT